jgi:hypothetical protein
VSSGGTKCIKIWQRYFRELIITIFCPNISAVKYLEKFKPPCLTRPRIFLALGVAICADGLQLLLNAVGWLGPDQVIDCVAMILTMWIVGFHVLLLPTFVVELVPLVDDFPTWTACVAAVIALRKREEKFSATPPPNFPPKPTIEV